jgi:hypothetical protein
MAGRRRETARTDARGAPDAVKPITCGDAGESVRVGIRIDRYLRRVRT